MHCSERACVMKEECECNFINASNPFVGVEFLLPDESPADDVHMCVLCHRRFVQSLFHDIVYSGLEYRGVVQRYGNMCGQPSEYAREVMLICPVNGPTHCLPFPAVSHHRNRYTIECRNGVRYLCQNKMSPQDFY